MRCIHALSFLALAGILALGAANLSARAGDAAPAKVGSISGKVVDKDGAPVAGATVVANFQKPKEKDKEAPKTKADEPTTQPKKPAPHKVITGEDGTFTIANLPEGKYTVVASKKNAGEGRVKDVVVTADKDTALESSIVLEVKAKKAPKN